MSPPPAVRLRPLLLPVEHGGWGFLLEPVVIALIAVPGAATVLLALAALGLFLSRQPLKVAIDDARHRRRVPRTRVAWTIAAGYLLAGGCRAGWSHADGGAHLLARCPAGHASGAGAVVVRQSRRQPSRRARTGRRQGPWRGGGRGGTGRGPGMAAGAGPVGLGASSACSPPSSPYASGCSACTASGPTIAVRRSPIFSRSLPP